MASKGVKVEQLDDYPDLLHVEEFYQTMYRLCGTDFMKISIYCEIHKFSDIETLEALNIMALISGRIHHASNTTRT